CQQVYLNPPSF
nr:immunoglobulin light chain junction region [Macaca mulatta]MOW43364.1 immunoglobulin light chain junction region [Macaca mulatta]